MKARSSPQSQAAATGPIGEVRPSAPADPTELRRPWREHGALVGLLAGAFVIALDFFIALVALPSIQRSLASSNAELQLMVASYATAYAAGLVASGRLGDAYGSHRMFRIGLLLFGLASLGAALAPSTALMIAARIAQGLAGAMLQPQIIAILALRFRGEARGRAFAAYALSQALAGVLGQLSAGWVISLDLGGWAWRPGFLIAMPVVLLAAVLVRRSGVECAQAERSPVDWTGMLLGSGALSCLIWSLTVGRAHVGIQALAGGAGAAVLLAVVFAMQQRRLYLAGGRPTLPLHLIRRKPIRFGLACVFLFYFGLMSFYWLFSVRTQQEMGLDPAATGRLFAVYGVMFMVSTLAGPALSRRYGTSTLAHGAWLMALGHAAGVLAAHGDPNILWMGLALAVTGIGIGLVMAPLLALVTAGASTGDAGALAGTIGTVQSAANALGTAIVPLAYVVGESAHRASGTSDIALDGYQASLLLLSGLAMVLALLSKRASAG